MHSTETDFDHWQRLKDVFNEAVELAPDRRRAYLSALRLDAETLSRELAELIASEEESADFLVKPIAVNVDSHSAAQSFVGAEIGHYRIVREIERGGMGAVYEAVRRDGDFEQRVAVKITDRRFLSDEFLRRFNNERRILARLEHPNVVRLFDGGILPDETPYFVMEYVEGVALNRYCQENGAGLKEKLDLFMQVCAAVNYAHQQLIVHRDLKPSNILVTKNGRVKLLDFGIAKTLKSDAQTQTVNTPLTPAYASPEQIKNEAITTLSDVYSLGVVLYELLTEQTPAQIYRTNEIGLPQAICETDPYPPSAAISKKFEVQSSKSDAETSENDKRQIATVDQTINPKPKTQNRKSLRGDLDNIVLKALSKEKERRYNSVERFAEDIKNYLNGLPVKAHPQSFEYRAAKFVRRNRLAVLLAAIAALLIAGGVVAAIWQSFEAQRERQIAEQNFNQVRKIANSLIFDYHDEIAKFEGSTKLREKLVVDGVNYLDAVSHKTADNAELLKESAIAYRKIGDVQGRPYGANLGKLDEALISYQKSVASLEKAVSLAPADITFKDELLKSYEALSQAKRRAGARAEAETVIRKALALCEEMMAIDNDLERKIFFIKMQMTLGDAQGVNPDKYEVYQHDLNRFNKYEIYSKALAEANSLYSSNQNNAKLIRAIGGLNNRLGIIVSYVGGEAKSLGDTEKANDFYRQSLEYRRQALFNETIVIPLDPENNNLYQRNLFVSHMNISDVLISLGRAEEALKNLEIAENLNRNLIKNDDHNRELILDRVNILDDKHKIFAAQGKYEAALKESDSALALAEECYRLDASNREAIAWIAKVSTAAAKLAADQRKDKEAEKYRRIFLDYRKQHVQRFGDDWEFKL